MQTKNQISLTRKALYVIMLLGVFLSAFGGGNLSPAHAQEPGTPMPEATETLIATMPTLITNADNITAQAFPTFVLPWDSSNNGKVLWTSGPHSWSRGGNFQAKIGISRGSGLDFAMGGQSFNVLAMASGIVIKNKCGFIGLGCIVAVRHNVGGSIMIYGHLKSNSDGTAPLNELVEGNSYPQGYLVGYAGNTGGNWPVHLHIEFRDGASSCTATASGYDGNDCSDIGWAGNPIGWDGKKLIDNYYIVGYLSTPDSCGDPECDVIFNYDGSAVIGPILAPFIDFPYRDKKDSNPTNDIQRKVGVLAYVHPSFFGPPPDYTLPPCATTPTCEINALDYTTVFAEQGLFQGGGSILNSTNSQMQTSDNTPPSGSWTSPTNGQTISSRAVTLSVNASDNSGGSGVKEVRFSAMWGGMWRGVGTASSSPYSVSWDMCSSGVPDGDIELGFEVWDNANNKWVYSEHSTNYHINKNYACTQGTDTTPPTASWTSPGNGQTISSQIVTLSANASDNSGGSGVREVRWSAKWNNTWYGVGSDTTAPYSTNWDMCAVNVPNGDVELGMEVWDNANNVWIYSQHYTNYHINKNYTCNGNTSGSWETWGWQNHYLAGYDNWHGTVTWTNYPYIWWDFGTGGPFGWGGNDFSLRMQRDVYFPGGDYSFHTDHDDGARVYIDGQLIIDAWWDGNGGHDAGRYVSQGNHQVKVEYYENQGDALIHVLWYGPGYPRPDNNPPDGHITSPTNFSATAFSPLTITADASDDASGVNRVEFYVWYCDASCNWRLISTDYSSPYSASWDWSAITDQHVYLTTHVVDNTGKVNVDPGGYVEIDLDRTKPTASINSPLDGATLNGNPITISVDAGDSLSGVGAVQFIMGYSETGAPSLNGANSLPAPGIIDSSGMMMVAELPQAATYWHEIGWDYIGSDGWSLSWNPASVPDQTGINAFVYTYDKAGNYQSAIRVDISLYRPPSNDEINTPVQIAAITYTNQQNTINATSAADDPALSACNRAPGDATVWYQFTPSSSGYYNINTIGSDYDTMLAVWTGARGNLNLIGCNDDRSSDLQSELILNASSGVIYYIEIAKYAGPLAINLSVQSGDKLNVAGNVSALSGGMLNFNVSESYQIYLPLVIR